MPIAIFQVTWITEDSYTCSDYIEAENEEQAEEICRIDNGLWEYIEIDSVNIIEPLSRRFNLEFKKKGE